ncbi:MAG: glycosyltransferase family 2 protein [Bacilli bacterium]|nr:glycosyltransferase family 2 protein [Bacilli bacterium]MDD4733541.1 glycosyltransferase family 2 protein [Bacilli bacterium]
MSVELLISTMNLKNIKEHKNLIKKMNITGNSTTINQVTDHSIQLFDDLGKNSVFSFYDKGLSKSRNIAIEKSKSDICIIADDDVVYVDDYEKIVKNFFNLYSDADIITFQVEGIGKKFKSYYNKIRKHNYITTMKVASVEIAIKRNSVIKNDIKFNENFGSGAKYKMGEENIFLTQCLKKGLKIIYVPVKIANLYMGDSTWFNGYDKDFFISKGAAFTEISKKYSTLLIIQFAIRKYKLFKEYMKISQAIKYMKTGKQQYLKMVK